jgi:diguanylate cyclase
MIEHIEILSEALPLNGIDSGFRNMHDRDFQRACLDAVKDVLGKVLRIHSPSMGLLSAKVDYLSDGYAVEEVELPGGIPLMGRKAWSKVTGGLLEPDTFEVMENQGYRYAGVVLVFQGRELMRISFLLEAPGADVERFNDLVSTCAIMSAQAVRLEELRYLSRHDALTGLANRTLFLARIASEIQTLQSGQGGAYIFEIRLACLDLVNDNFGLHAGDELILEAARRLSALNGGRAFVARVGGSKFMLLLSHEGPENLAFLMRDVEGALEHPVTIEGQGIQMTFDIGCVAIDDPQLHPVEVLQRAEMAVSDAQSRSVLLQQKTYIYKDTFFETKRQNSRLNLLVRQAYSEKRFFLLFQPLVDLRKTTMIGCEALLRMLDPSGQTIEAARFMPAVERIRYESTLDKWVFEEIMRLYGSDKFLRQRLKAGGFKMAMNCDPKLLSQNGLSKEWLSRFEQAEFDPKGFSLEMVEHPILFESSVLMQNLRTLRREGVQIAVDDFGSGHSNLRYLAGLPIDLVKLDRGFLKGVGDNRSREARLLKAILDLCAELGYESLCEGVETQAHADFLKSIDCSSAQGYFYGKPMPLPEVLALADRYDAAPKALG